MRPRGLHTALWRSVGRLTVSLLSGLLSAGLLSACASGGPEGRSDAGGVIIPRTWDAGGGGTGECGFRGGSCCSGFCNMGLTCDPTTDRCEGAACGAAGQECCAEGAPCQTGLSCLVSGLCEAAGVDAGPPSCGARGSACCASIPECASGLACMGGTCLEAAGCGATGQTCCAGGACNSGLTCDPSSNTCRSSTAPTCVPDGGACTTSADCCSSDCVSGTCDNGGTLPPCGSFATCGSCTDTPHCMDCGGSCVDYFLGGEFLCAVYPEDC